MWWLRPFVAILVLAGVAHAQEMVVRTGEHGEFTRLVLEFDVLPEWRTGRSEAGYTITFDGNDEIRTDLSRAFALINRERIGGIDVDGARRRIDVALACECYAEVFDLNGTTLVMDVYNGPAGESARFEDSLSPAVTLSGVPFFELSEPELRAPKRPDPRRIDGGRGETPVARPVAPTTLIPPAEFAARVSSSAPDANDLRVAAGADARDLISALPTIDRLPTVNSIAVETLTQQLSRAASQGLIALPPPGETINGGDRMAAPGPRNFRVFTGVDRATGTIAVETDATFDGRSCFPDSYVDVNSWGDTKNAAELGRKRQSIVKETGALDLEAMKSLARYYVALGFGAEARFAAQKLPESDERAVLLVLADIMDTGESPSTLLDGQLACPGRVALWAALTGPFKRAELPVSTDIILTTFSSLPPHLREHLGPTLSQRLRNAGETALARAALSAVTRAGSGSVGQELTAARLELVGTRAAEARADLERIAQGTNAAAAEALIELLQDAQRRRVPPKPEWVDDADALIRITNGTRTAEELNVAMLRGHISLGRFNELRREITDGGPGLTQAVRTDLSAEALSTAVTDADDQTFIRTELGLSDFAPPDTLDSSKRYEMVQRFLDLGLPALASKYLPETSETPEELRLAAATISALDRREEALALLVGEKAEPLADIRAELLTSLGDFPRAASILADIGRADEAELQALRSGDWAWISEQGPVDLSSTVRAATAPESLSQSDRINASLIDDLAKRRAAYVDLLSRTQPVTSR